MATTATTGFYKNENCPSSGELLEFQKGEMPKAHSGEVRRHLASCEFCSAEVAFYTHYPQEEATTEAFPSSEIPAPLFELAEALLKNRHSDASSLDSLLKEAGGLVLDKA